MGCGNLPRGEIMSLVKERSGRSRLNVRLSPEIKERITRAAHILGQDLTEFTADTMNQRAVEVLDENEMFQLTETERRFFLNFLEGEPPKPTKRALASASKYKQGKDNGLTYEFED